MATLAKNGQPDAPIVRRNWFESVSYYAVIIARNAFWMAGFENATLVTYWRDIVGPETAALCRPLKLSKGTLGRTLTLKAEPAAAVFLQHDTRRICEKINLYMGAGAGAVTRLRFIEGPLLASLWHPLPTLSKPVDPPPADPARHWQGPPNLGKALLELARQRTRARPMN